MSTFRVKVKWGKQKFEDVELDTSDAPLVFKMQLFSLTGVPPERQTVMVMGSRLADEDWGKAKGKLKDNSMVMLMGSAEQLPAVPKEPTKFIEDMSEAEAAAVLSLPMGLENFGNTCYINSTVQCLHCVPELRDALKRQQDIQRPVAGQDNSSALTTSLGVLYDFMERGVSRIGLVTFLQSLHKVVPAFAEKDPKTGAFLQQDAHECWSVVVNCLTQTLKESFMDQFFGVRVEHTLKCVENVEEPSECLSAKQFQLSCFISQDTRYLHTGIKKSLSSTVEKQSPSLGREVQYESTALITRLPAYLPVQLIRFYVGRSGASEEIVSKKILKDVKFPMKLDVFEFCSPKLQEALMPQRLKFKQVEDQKAAKRAKLIAEGAVLGPKAATELGKGTDAQVEHEPFDFPTDKGCSNSGYYRLLAVLTHQGRSSSSGHYVAWVRWKADIWLKLDDDNVSEVSEEEVLKLSGGGDWHMAYMLLYEPLPLEKLSPTNDEPCN